MSDVDVTLMRQLLRYHPDSGTLVWLERPVEMFRDSATTTAAGTCKWWNGRFAGREAFTARCVDGRHGRIFSVLYYAHRVAWALHYGEWPSLDIDHQDGDRSNNRISNLRLVTHQQNMQNKKIYRSNSSGCHGVALKRSSGRWQAYITINGKRQHIGYFADREQAIAARREAEREADVFHKNHGRAA